MKKAVAISLAIFFSAILAIFVFGLVFNKDKTAAPPTIKISTKSNLSGAITFSLSEVAKHNDFSDCWLIIDNKVYDVSKYLEFNLHPGEAGTITPYCGKEAARAFATKDKARPQPHSAEAGKLLNDYYIGDLTP